MVAVCVLPEQLRICLRNRFLLALICCPIYHWLDVSREVDVSRAQSASDIFSATDRLVKLVKFSAWEAKAE